MSSRWLFSGVLDLVHGKLMSVYFSDVFCEHALVKFFLFVDIANILLSESFRPTYESSHTATSKTVLGLTLICLRQSHVTCEVTNHQSM